ncbi:fimbrial protein [Salmonella enterica]|nr:fimbrial protein [Salmonella enterica]EKK6346507.1 fimbrial protein [Salmonella enterica]ELO7821420.1 fimbrial protein [Salmonella enterica]ELR6878436.1 fimbrial protein [Salmonella enterica]MJK42728.1 fimbrial protein StdA [Salmonella enterica subsp. diarizonae]
MRNKTILAIAAVGMMYGTSAFAEGQFGSGTITFRGTILDSPCDVSVTGPDGTRDAVAFGQVSKRALDAASAVDETHSKVFTVNLKNCSFDTATESGVPHSKVAVSFSGTQAAGSKKAFIGGVNHTVGVQLSDASGAIIDPADAVKPVTPGIQLHDGDNTLYYTAKLMNVGEKSSVTAGAFDIPVNYTLKYN